MSETETVAERVRRIVVNELDVEEEAVTFESSFMADLEADSLDTVELIMCLEEAFDIEIPDQDAEWIETVGQAVAYVEKKLADKEPAEKA